MIQRIQTAIFVATLALTTFAGKGWADPGAQGGLFTLPRGANPDNVVMDAESGPVGFALAENDRLIACQYLPGQTPYDDKTSRTKAFILFDLKSGREIQRTPFQMNFAGNFWACSNDGRYLVLGARAKTYQLDLEKGVIVRTWTPKEAFGLPAVSPDGSILALADNRVVSLYDLSSGELIRQLPAHPSRIGTLTFDADGKGVLSSCSEVTRRWDLASSTSKNFSVHDRFRSLAFDPNGSQLIGTHQADNTKSGASCFDLRSGRRLTYLKNHLTMATDFSGDRWYTLYTEKDELVDAVQVHQLSRPETAKFLPFDAKMRQLASQHKVFWSSNLQLSPDNRYLLLRIRGGFCSQVWRLDSLTTTSLLSSASQLKHKYVPAAPKIVNKTREELFLDEIWSIREKVWDLCDSGKKDQAVKEIETLLAAGERRLQRAPRRHQSLIINCAQAYISLNREKCLALNLKAMEMAESANRLDSDWELAVSEAASAMSSLGDREKAAKMFERVIDHRKSKGLPIKSSDYSKLASLKHDFHNPQSSPESIELYYLAWVQSKAEHGTLHENTRHDYDTLVESVQSVGGWEMLEPVLVEQLKEYERDKGPGHPETAQAVQQLAQLYERLEKPEQALTTMDRSQRVLRDHVARVLPSMSEAEQREFLERYFQPALDAALEMAVRLRKHPDAAELSAAWILNAKGTATRALAERARIAASTSDPQVQAIATELAEVRETLSSLGLASVASPDPSVTTPNDPADQRLEELRQRESELSWKLGLAGWTELRQDPWTSLSEVREKVPGDSVLIELTITGLSQKHVSDEGPDPGRESDIGPQHEPPKVVMWIIPPADRGSVRMAVVSDNLMRLVQPLAGFHASVSGQVGGATAAALTRDSLAAISQQLVRPLPQDVLRAKRWLISPDHLLWMIPWSALPESGDRLVVHRHQVQYLLSGRDLLTLPSAESQSVPMIVANPDYGTNPSGETNNAAFSPLPGTAREAQGVYPYMKRLGNSEPDVFLGAKAMESVVKAAQRPKVALFSTHGFASINPGQHPMATCGLALAGANAAIRGDGDGVLTGLEILASDYRGTDLVVLSACQTALGNISSGEGVASLRYAFQLAGAKNVAATLWSIPDEITAEMMKDFFKNYSAGRSPSAALRLAQLATIRRLESDGIPADPSLWAAFTIAGPPQEEDQSGGLAQQWRSANGKFTIIAELLDVDDNNAVLRKLDGAEIQVPLNQLHPADRSAALEAI